MNRNDLKEYYRRLKEGQQNQFVGESKLLKEGIAGMPGMHQNSGSSFGMPANRSLPGALENLAADVQDMIDNAVGQVDLDYSDDPLTKRDILDFVIRMLVEEQSII